MNLYLGIDIGTSGVRSAIVNGSGSVVSRASANMEAPRNWNGRPAQEPQIWWNAVDTCLFAQARDLELQGLDMSFVRALAVDGTSGTLLLADADLQPVTPGLMYNSSGFFTESEMISRFAPDSSITLSPSSTLARLLHLQALPEARKARYAMHQSDWIMSRMTGRGGHSDNNNVLKLGFDAGLREWPNWLGQLGGVTGLLPRVYSAGTPLDCILPEIADRFGLRRSVEIVAGTTDSVAAFVASRARSPGDAVTSLGTTLAVKLLSDTPVESARHGVYSHRIFGLWLAGGASNTGGGALGKHFSNERLQELEPMLNPDEDTGLDYYPLPGAGERFPVADPQLAPRETPRPDDDARFLQGLMEGIARIELAGYVTLRKLGATDATNVKTTGGGARSNGWQQIRQRILGRPVSRISADAAEGSALIASHWYEFQ